LKQEFPNLGTQASSYEYRLRKRAEVLEQARLLDEQAQRFKEKQKIFANGDMTNALNNKA
jgi:NADH dehydrogenase FAD-containing subunit